MSLSLSLCRCVSIKCQESLCVPILETHLENLENLEIESLRDPSTLFSGGCIEGCMRDRVTFLSTPRQMLIGLLIWRVVWRIKTPHRAGTGSCCCSSCTRRRASPTRSPSSRTPATRTGAHTYHCNDYLVTICYYKYDKGEPYSTASLPRVDPPAERPALAQVGVLDRLLLLVRRGAPSLNTPCSAPY